MQAGRNDGAGGRPVFVGRLRAALGTGPGVSGSRARRVEGGMGLAVGSAWRCGACLSAQAGCGRVGRVVKKTGHRRGGSRSVSAGRPLFFGAAEGGVPLPVAREGDETRERLGPSAEETTIDFAGIDQRLAGIGR